MLASKQVLELSRMTLTDTPAAGPIDASGTDDDRSPARLRTAVFRMARWLRPTAAAGTLTATEVDMLMVADRRGPARMSDFAAFCGLNPTMLSRLAPRLEEAGLLARGADPADRRVTLIEATDQARELLGRVRSERTDILTALLAELEPEEQQAVAAATPVLEKLAEMLRDQAQVEGQRK
jgi:DNA-binding MarR family transcriptional regulator